MKYLGLLKYELKSIIKDRMTLFMFVFPLFMLIILAIIMPLSMHDMPKIQLAGVYPIILLIILCMVPLIGGILLGFSILENKDEKTLNTIAVTPFSIKGYLIFKSLYCTAIGFLGNLILLYGLKLFAYEVYISYNPQTFEFIRIFDILNFTHIISFSFTSSALTAAFGLLIGSFAKNKVEGFVYIKAGGMFFLVPALTLLAAFGGGAQYFLGIFPNFWSLKALQNILFFNTSAANLSFYTYQLIGLLYSLLLSFLSYKIFIKKLQTSA